MAATARRWLGAPAAVLLAATGMPFGILDDVTWEEQLVRLDPGDRAYLHSDGAVEPMNLNGEQFGADQLQSILSDQRADPSTRRCLTPPPPSRRGRAGRRSATTSHSSPRRSRRAVRARGSEPWLH
jgi:hypothetical protein